MSESGETLPRWLGVAHPDPATRLRAVNALVITYATIGLGVAASVPLSLIPGGLAIAAVVLATQVIFVATVLLLRSGRVNAGLTVFFAAFLGSFVVSQLAIHDSRLTAVYCVAPVIIAGVTLRRRGVAAVTAVALVIAFGGILLWPTTSPAVSTREVAVAAGVLFAVAVVSGLLGLWGLRREARRADGEAARSSELAARLTVVNAELERRVEQRTDELLLALARQESLVAELADLSLRDPLTGLYNRRHAEHELPRLLAAADRYEHPLAMAMADLDHFKRVNDDHSYAVGDEVLMAFAHLLRDIARGSDLVTRYGGEEFLIVMPHTTLDQAVVVCERLRRAVESHPWADVVPGLHQTVSIGVAGSLDFPSRGDLTAAADAALHAAKREGRNRVEPASAPVGRA